MRVGFIQNNPVFGEIGYNLSQIEPLLSQHTVDLMVLPELFSTGYHFLNQKEALGLSESIPEGPTTQTLIRICNKNQTSIIAGIAERYGNRSYNSAVIIGPNGYLGKYRKYSFLTPKKTASTKVTYL
jgi:predicted amidohydrolase